MKDIVVLGGPKGAGKTTAARVLLSGLLRWHVYLNADEIARGISPGNTEAAALRAGRLMIQQTRVLVREGTSFAFESTLSGKSYLHLLRRCKTAGWRIALLFFWLPSPQDAIARVARRVSEGGHAIPSAAVRRRYYAGLSNMRHLYLPLADEAEIYDNSDRNQILIAEKREGLAFTVRDPTRWAKIEEAAP